MPDALTLDSNTPVEYWKNHARVFVVEKLLALAKAGEVSLLVTARIREDIPREPLASQIDRLPELASPRVRRSHVWAIGCWGETWLGFVCRCQSAPPVGPESRSS